MSKRLNITVSDSVHEELKQISEEFGMPISSIGAVAIMTYLQQQKALLAMGDLKSMLAQMTALQEGAKQ